MIPATAMGWWWRWFTYVNPVSWSLYGLLASQLGDIQASIIDFDGSVVTVSTFMEERFGYYYRMVNPIIAILCACILFFRGVSIYALTQINFQKR